MLRYLSYLFIIEILFFICFSIVIITALKSLFVKSHNWDLTIWDWPLSLQYGSHFPTSSCPAILDCSLEVMNDTDSWFCCFFKEFYFSLLVWQKVNQAELKFPTLKSQFSSFILDGEVCYLPAYVSFRAHPGIWAGDTKIWTPSLGLSLFSGIPPLLFSCCGCLILYPWQGYGFLIHVLAPCSGNWDWFSGWNR